MPAWFLDKGAETTRVVGRVVVKSPAGKTVGFGTGFLVPDGLLITCRHVIPSVEEAQTSAVQFDYPVAPDGSVAVAHQDAERGTGELSDRRESRQDDDVLPQGDGGRVGRPFA
jgi:hypothetical protein